MLFLFYFLLLSGFIYFINQVARFSFRYKTQTFISLLSLCRGQLLNIHTIKPLDEEIVLKAAKECGKVITAEEHNVIGV